ncbi:MAG TPA: PilN domain-containing protein [Gammaproteobacteria bacterium]|nr:PilN domain-containing protein [Gammaproteobacteria bacterium]
MPRINLLPWREERRKQRQQSFNMLAGVVVAIAALVVLSMYGLASIAISSQEARNAYLKEQIAGLDKQIAQIKELQDTKQQLLARMQIIEELQQSRPTEVHVFDQLVQTLPPGVYLTHITQKGTGLHLEGVAESSARVSAYMRNIDASMWLGDPNLQVVQKDNSVKPNTHVQKFSVTANIIDKAAVAAKKASKGGKKP